MLVVLARYSLFAVRYSPSLLVHVRHATKNELAGAGAVGERSLRRHQRAGRSPTHRLDTGWSMGRSSPRCSYGLMPRFTSTRTSTRRLAARPSAVMLSETGFESPSPTG